MFNKDFHKFTSQNILKINVKFTSYKTRPTTVLCLEACHRSKYDVCFGCRFSQSCLIMRQHFWSCRLFFGKFGKYSPITAPNITSVQYRLLLIGSSIAYMLAMSSFLGITKKKFVTLIATKRLDQF